MAFGQSPFSEKTQWGPLLQAIASMITQGMMVGKMGREDQGKQPGLPPSTMPIQQRTQGQLPPQPATMQQGPPQGSPQAQGQFLKPMGGPPGPPRPPQMGQQGPPRMSPEAKIAQALPPELQSIFFEILKLAKFPENKPPQPPQPGR